MAINSGTVVGFILFLIVHLLNHHFPLRRGGDRGRSVVHGIHVHGVIIGGVQGQGFGAQSRENSATHPAA
jgi:hypothetical protein